MKTMNENSLNHALFLAVEIFDGTIWTDQNLEILDWEIEDILNDILDELNENLIGQNLIYKEDVIRIYISTLAKIYDEILTIHVSNDDELNNCNKAINKVKNLYQKIIDTICGICIINSINLKKIVDLNHYSFSNIDISIYNEEIENSKLNLNQLVKKTKSNIQAYFTDLLNNFNIKFSNHNKFSCVYRLMLKDGFITDEFRPERLKSLLRRPPYGIKIDFYLKRESDLSKIIVKHYNDLKEIFFNT
jgi:hypothetical protein